MKKEVVLMDVRYILRLENKDKDYYSGIQLFGYNESYNTFDNYLRSLGVNLEDKRFEDVEIPSLMGLLKVIDETVWYDVILKDGLKEKEGSNGEPRYYSEMLDFTPNLIEKRGNDLRVKGSLLGVATMLVYNAHLFTSYLVLQWLQESDVLKGIKFEKMKCSFIGNPDFILSGSLKKGYRLTISRV